MNSNNIQSEPLVLTPIIPMFVKCHNDTCDFLSQGNSSLQLDITIRKYLSLRGIIIVSNRQKYISWGSRTFARAPACGPAGKYSLIIDLFSYARFVGLQLVQKVS